MNNPAWLNVQAARLFRMAADARRKGDTRYAEVLTEGACRCLDRIADHENASVSAPAVTIERARD